MATAADITALTTKIFKRIRSKDLQGFSNKDFPDMIGKLVALTGFAAGVQTTISLAVADIANLYVNDVLTFAEVTDSQLQTELQNLTPEQLKIRLISGSDVLLYLNSNSFTGVYAAGYVSSTYNKDLIEDFAEDAIDMFENDSGVRFLNTSNKHLTICTDKFKIENSIVTGAESIILQDKYEKAIEKIQFAKNVVYDASDISLDEDDYQMYNNDKARDMGLEDFKQFD